MKIIGLIPLLALAACQSIEDSVSQNHGVQATPGYVSESPLGLEDLSMVASNCETQISTLYTQRVTVPQMRQKDFSIALAQASRSCERLQRALKIVKESPADKSTFDQNVSFAQGLVGAVGGGDSFGQPLPTDFPEAGTEDVTGPDILPQSSISAEPLAPTPLYGQ